MRRGLFAVLLVTMGLTAAPATTQTQSVSAPILLPAYGTPAPARTLYATDPTTNGIVGYVIQLSVKSGTFSLSAVAPMTNLEGFDIYFYADLTSSTPTGSFFECDDPIPQCPKSGSIPGGSKYAVVTMSLGLDESFSYVAHS